MTQTADRPARDDDSPTVAWRRRRRETFGRFVDPDALDRAVDEGELEPADATFAAELVDLTGLDGRSADALVVALLAASAARRRGSVRLDLTTGGADGLADRLANLMPALDADERLAAAAEQLNDGALDTSDPMIGAPGDRAPLVVEDGQLYRHRDWAQERRVADALADRIDDRWRSDHWPDPSRWSAKAIRRALRDVSEQSAVPPTDEQMLGAATAAGARLSLVTGGPGTGKTRLVVSLLRLLDQLDVSPEDVALAAPTGKAADRLGDALRRALNEGGETDPLVEFVSGLDDPATVHRLLGYSDRRREFHHDEYRPLPHRYVVIDEASMVDLELMDRLLAAVDSEASLVLVGDADQLPAVGSGAVFRDLVPDRAHVADGRRRAVPSDLDPEISEDPLAAQSAVLTQNFRMTSDGGAGGGIVAAARALRDGGQHLCVASDPTDDLDPDAPVIVDRSCFEDLEWSGVELLDDAGSGSPDELMEKWYRGRVLDALQTSVDDTWSPDTSLTFDADRPVGGASDRLDELFAGYRRVQLLAVTRKRSRGVARLDAALHRLHVRAHGLSGERALVAGEPVMMTRNDYERGLFNGDRGLIVRTRQTGRTGFSRRAVFPSEDGYRAYGLGPLTRDLVHAWSITVHKSQGSEFQSVGFVLPDEEIPLLTRELIYTGMTRAEQSVAFFGEAERLHEAAARGDERHTGLVEKIDSEL